MKLLIAVPAYESVRVEKQRGQRNEVTDRGAGI